MTNWGRRCFIASMIVGWASSLTSCGGSQSNIEVENTKTNTSAEKVGGASEPKVLNLYIWANYLAPDTLENFKKLTGIKVNISYVDSGETSETKILAGHSGFDVVDQTIDNVERQIKAGVYQPLDKSKLPGWSNLDPQILRKIDHQDPQNAHAMIYMWGTTGIGYNAKMIKALVPDAPLDSWRLIFDPAVASKLAKCGISLLDSPTDVLHAVLPYLGRDPNSQAAEDLAAAEAALMKIRPYIRTFSSGSYIESLANGDLCVALGFNGVLLQARDRAQEANKGIEIGYVIPKEGSVLWFDMFAIPKDAPHMENAYAFLNYILSPKVVADISNARRFANANAAAQPLLLPEVRNDPGIYPSPEVLARLVSFGSDTPETMRVTSRMFQRLKSGQ